MGRRSKIAIVCNLDHMASPSERLTGALFDEEWLDADIIILAAAVRHGWTIDGPTLPAEYLTKLGENVVRGMRKLDDHE